MAQNNELQKVPINRLNLLNKLHMGHKLQYISLPIITLLFWKFLLDMHVIETVALPSPEKVAASFYKLISNGQIFKHISISILCVMEGYLLAALLGIILGIMIGLSQMLNRVTEFIIQLLKPIPPIAWIPLAIIWFGIGETSKIFLIFLGGFFPTFLNVIDGIRQTEHKLVEVSNVLEASRYRFIFKLVIPGALPSIMTGLRIGIGSAWVCVVAAELIAAESGIGYLIMDARQLSQPEIVIVGMITIGLVGKMMDTLLKKIELLLIKWRINYQGN